MTRYQRLLVPLDGTELSARATADSLALAAQLGATVVGFVVESLPPLPSTGTQISTYTQRVAEHEARTEAHAQGVLKSFAEAATTAGVAFESAFDRGDDIAGAIAGAAERLHCDMIVMVTHGRGLFGELLFGSQTKTVLSRTRTPVLVLH